MPSAYLWCPAYPLVDADQLAGARAGGARFAAALGYDLVEAPSLSRLGRPGEWRPAAERAAEFAQALGHGLAIAARGGYGCVDLATAALAHAGPLPQLVGFSDLTVLHACWRRRGAGESCYGFMPAATRGARALESAIACARGSAIALDPPRFPEALALHPGNAEGELFAACLSVLAALCGTPALPSLAGTILALEDIDERPYRIDRTLSQLHAAGALAGVRALVFGSMRSPAAPGYGGPSAIEVCRAWAARLAVPAVFALPFGHEDDPVALPCGRPATLVVGSGSWRLDIAARRGLNGGASPR